MKEYLSRLCRRKFLFIIASGRSGSTTLLNMVNELPGCSLSGENDGQLHAWHELYRKFTQTQRRIPYSDYQVEYEKPIEGPGRGRGAWSHQVIHDWEFYEMLQDWVFEHTGLRNETGYYNRAHQDFIGKVDIVRGNKEIRYNNPQILEFISKAFPCAKFIFNCRRETFQEQSHSGFLQLQPNRTSDELKRQADFLRKYSKKPHMADRSLVMYMEDFDDLEKWNTIASWLDRPFCTFSDIFHDNIDGGYSHEWKEKPMLKCDLPKQEKKRR